MLLTGLPFFFGRLCHHDGLLRSADVCSLLRLLLLLLLLLLLHRISLLAVRACLSLLLSPAVLLVFPRFVAVRAGCERLVPWSM